MHPPLYPVYGRINPKTYVASEEVGLLSRLLKEAGVDIVFCGHEHFYARLVYDGFALG